MCHATVIEGGFLHLPPSACLDIRAFYLCLSSCSATTPMELTLAYHPAIRSTTQGLNDRALPPATPTKVTLHHVAVDPYASADRVAAAEGARFEVLAAAGEEVAAEGIFSTRREGVARGVRRALASPEVCVVEVVVLMEGGVLMQDRAHAAGRGQMRCGTTRLEGIPEEDATTGLYGWCHCECDNDEWEVVGDAEEEEQEVEMETESGANSIVCVAADPRRRIGVGEQFLEFERVAEPNASMGTLHVTETRSRSQAMRAMRQHDEDHLSSALALLVVIL
ncbi:hypothetical protein ZEAMMB73_Zm00001d004027 [Zea mays]|uniref:Uncharacterized protein n=1 Tax=Zea mays TaxID=4577 RepID=A0A1D6ED24_MAIZE|nr:hypothetical protein ZEAMMB73_Zm00001d004027 [Zea mays]